MASGIIYLYDWQDKLMKQKTYNSVEQRRKIMDHWRSYALEGDYFRIYVRRGILISGNTLREIQKVPKNQPPKFERPPAIYNNIKTYNYGGQ